MSKYGLRYFNKKDTSKIGYLDKDLNTIIDYKTYKAIDEKTEDWVSLNPHGNLRICKLYSTRTHISIKEVKPIIFKDLLILFKNKLIDSDYKVDYAYRYGINTSINFSNHKECLSVILGDEPYPSFRKEIFDIPFYIDFDRKQLDRLFPFDKDSFDINDNINEILDEAFYTIQDIYHIQRLDQDISFLTDKELEKRNLFKYTMNIDIKKILKDYNLIMDNNNNLFIKFL